MPKKSQYAGLFARIERMFAGRVASITDDNPGTIRNRKRVGRCVKVVNESGNEAHADIVLDDGSRYGLELDADLTIAGPKLVNKFKSFIFTRAVEVVEG